MSLGIGIRRERKPTGTRNKTPVIIEVKAVPPPTRDQMLPHNPITNAPKADMSVTRSDMTRVAAFVVAYDAQEKRTIT